jgi:hypothetical protein
MNKKVVYIGIFTLFILAGAAVTFYFLRSNSSTKTFAKLKAECEQNYNANVVKGRRYIQYPCSDTLIQAQYEKQ